MNFIEKKVMKTLGATHLIADCGSTKIHWAEISRDGAVSEFFSSGVNPAVMQHERIGMLFQAEVAPNLRGEVGKVDFYGAGCKGYIACDAVADALRSILPAAEIKVDSDMLGACRAVSPGKEGIVCILGTGANACRFDGERIVANVSPGGYILGDEGSGAWLGKRLAGDYLKGLLPVAAAKAFEQEFNINASSLIGKVYRPAAGELPPNRFLASFAPFLSANIGAEWAREIVTDGFTQFFNRNVVPCIPAGAPRLAYPVHFVGSVAGAFAPVLRSVAASTGFTVASVTRSPLPLLIGQRRVQMGV